MNPTTKGTLWALAAVTTSSGLPLLFVYSASSADPFAWRSWLLVFQVLTMLPIFLLVPSGEKPWRESARRLLSYWGAAGEPLRVRTSLDLLRTPAVWMAVSLALDLAFWAWAVTLIDPLVVTIIFQLMLIGMVWMAARLGRKLSNAEQTSPHVMGRMHWMLMVLSFAGAAVVIWSETGAVATLNWTGVLVALAGTAAASGGLWTTVSTGRLMAWPSDDPHDLVWNATFAAVAGRLGALPLTLLGSALFFPSAGGFGLAWTTAGPLALAGAFDAVASLAHRYSLYTTSSLSVQRVMFLSPALQMLWLWTFADVSIANPQALLVGTGVVLLGNVGWQTTHPSTS